MTYRKTWAATVENPVDREDIMTPLHFVTVLLAASTFLLMLVSTTASSDEARQAGACYTIHNADARAYCLAKAHRSPSYCSSIQNADLRAECRATVQQKKS